MKPFLTKGYAKRKLHTGNQSVQFDEKVEVGKPLLYSTHRFLMGFVVCVWLVVWGFVRRLDIYRHILINIWRRMDDQPQRAPRAQSFVVFSVSSEDSVVFSVLRGNITFLWSAETLKL